MHTKNRRGKKDELRERDRNESEFVRERLVVESRWIRHCWAEMGGACWSAQTSCLQRDSWLQRLLRRSVLSFWFVSAAHRRTASTDCNQRASTDLRWATVLACWSSYAWFPALRFRSSVSVSIYVIVSVLPFRSAVAVALTERIRTK